MWHCLEVGVGVGHGDKQEYKRTLEGSGKHFILTGMWVTPVYSSIKIARPKLCSLM